eukprot:2702617-Amphidinium_carterae.1
MAPDVCATPHKSVKRQCNNLRWWLHLFVLCWCLKWPLGCPRCGSKWHSSAHDRTSGHPFTPLQGCSITRRASARVVSPCAWV